VALRRKSRGEATIEVTSFADIAFLLIIFFILTTTFDRPAGNELDIPSGVADKTAQLAKTPTVNLSSTGITWGQGQENLSLDELRFKLLDMNLKAKPADKRVIILNSAADVPYERYFQVVMAIDAADGVLALVEGEEARKGTGP